jgi:hypothetical protein
MFCFQLQLAPIQLGTAIAGTANAKVENSEQTHSFHLSVSIAGGKHCPAHLTAMAEKGKGGAV